MARKTASSELTEFFAQEIQEDPNATLETIRQHLRNLSDSAPGDSAAQTNSWLQETEELIQTYGEHCPLRDFLPESK